MSREFDVLVVGAGVVGAVTASLLVARRICPAARVALVADRLPPAPAAGSATGSDWDLRVFALSRASERVLGEVGVWDALPSDRISAYERMCVWDAAGVAGGRGSLTFDSAEIGEANLGSIVDGRVLQSAALQAARAAGVVVIEAAISGLEVTDSHVGLMLADGRELRSQVTLAADGIDSPIRALSGFATAGHTYAQDALVAHIRTSQAHGNTAWQRFLPTGPLAFLPLPDGRSSIVWSIDRNAAARLRTLEPGVFERELTEASGAVLGACELASTIGSFPLRLQYAQAYVAPRIALLGDAAHVVHPLAGQGLNLGLLDCASLVDVLGGRAAGTLGDLSVLRRYERWRKSENLLSATAFDGLERLFSQRNAWVAGLRVFGLGAVGDVGWLRRELARRALGLTGDVPGFRADRPSPRR
jgi:2-octaprenylphenol hydroxylase